MWGGQRPLRPPGRTKVCDENGLSYRGWDLAVGTPGSIGVPMPQQFAVLETDALGWLALREAMCLVGTPSFGPAATPPPGSQSPALAALPQRLARPLERHPDWNCV